MTLLGELESNATWILEDLKNRLPGNSGAVILATCNRFEAYIDTTATTDDALSALVSSANRGLGVNQGLAGEMLQVLTDDSAVKQLFAVTAGLQSMVKGENEIRGQVRAAHALSVKKSAGSRFLDELFQSATNAGRQVSGKTNLLKSGSNLVSIALDRFAATGLNLPEAKCLIVGTGGYAKIVVATLREFGVSNVGVHSPSGRATLFAAHNELYEVSAKDLQAALEASDLVITASGAHGHYLLPDMFGAEPIVASHRRTKFVLDLAPSRDVHPEVAVLDGIELLDLERLAEIAPEAQTDEMNLATGIIEKAAEKFQMKQLAKLAEPGILTIRQSLGRLIEDEVALAQRTMDKDQAELFEQALTRIGNAFLHVPTVKAKQMAQSGKITEYEAAVQMLFDAKVSEK